MEKIENAVKKIKTILTILNIIEITGLFIINIVLDKMVSVFAFEDNIAFLIKSISNGFILIILIVQNVLLIRRMAKTKEMMNIVPIHGIIEDFIITSYSIEADTKYNVYFLVKNLKDGKLYFTYGDYSLSYYDFTYGKNGDVLSGINVFRKDGSTVKIGDIVYLYVKNYVNVNVEIDSFKNILKLNNQKIHYQNVNTKYDISIFKSLTYFEGIVEIEKKNY